MSGEVQRIVQDPYSINLRLQRPLDDYIAFYERLSIRSLPLIETLVSPLVSFKDPFFKGKGEDFFRAALAFRLKHVENMRIKITDHAWGRDKMTVYLRWSCSFIWRGKSYDIEGVSDVMFDMSGKVVSHIDHCDLASNVFVDLPVLGRALRYMLGRVRDDLFK